MAPPQRIGVIGGSGLYKMEGLENVREETVSTPFGAPSDNYIIGTLGDVEIVFLPRHGRGHVLNPSEVNYRANVFGMKKLGVSWIISVTAVGSLKEEIAPGDMVLVDQYIDRTVHRPATFFEKGIVAHVGFGNPVCEVLRMMLKDACDAIGCKYHNGGTYVNMEGPAFSTRAESEMHRSWGASVIGMTNMTEARLAREAEISFAPLSMSTDYDCWKDEHVTVEAVMATMSTNVNLSQQIIKHTVKSIAAYSGEKPPSQTALCGGGAIMTARDKIPKQLITDLAPIIGAYITS